MSSSKQCYIHRNSPKTEILVDWEYSWRPAPHNYIGATMLLLQSDVGN